MGAPQQGHGHDDRGGEATTVRPVAWVRRRAPDDTEPARVYNSAMRGAEVADADEALRKDVEEKPAEEFVGRERERADLAPVSIVLPPKGDGVVGHGHEPVIRDGDAVGVSREVVQDNGSGCQRVASRTPPTRGDRGIGPPRERAPQWRRERAGKVQAALRKSLPETGDEFAANTCRSTLTGRKKVGRAWIHRAPSGASPPAGTTQWTWG
jgi:hypothetical protein